MLSGTSDYFCCIVYLAHTHTLELFLTHIIYLLMSFVKCLYQTGTNDSQRLIGNSYQYSNGVVRGR